jgi:hypothetical protein
MKMTKPALLCLIALPLSGCAAGKAAGSLLKTPWNLLKGMTSAVGRTVTQNEAQPAADAAIAARGRSIEQKGEHRGHGAGAQMDGGSTVAQR